MNLIVSGMVLDCLQAFTSVQKIIKISQKVNFWGKKIAPTSTKINRDFVPSQESCKLILKLIRPGMMDLACLQGLTYVDLGWPLTFPRNNRVHILIMGNIHTNWLGQAWSTYRVYKSVTHMHTDLHTNIRRHDCINSYGLRQGMKNNYVKLKWLHTFTRPS